MFPKITFTIFVSVLFVAIATPSDPSGWENVFASNRSHIMPLRHFEGKTYYLGYHIKASYMLATQFCSNIHMKLLSIRSERENNMIHKFMRDANKLGGYWTSGAKFLDDLNWIWMAYGQNIEYTNWGINQPDDAHDKCLQVYSNGNNLLWNDLNCDALNYFICERYEPRLYASYLNNRESTWDDLMTQSSISANIGLLHFGQKKYYFAKYITGSFMQALEFCKIINMQLVSIKDKEENDRLSKYIRDTNSGKHWWSSGSRLLDGKNWVWFTKGTPVDFTNWDFNQPNSNDQMCLKLVHSNENGIKWADEYCTATNRIICESNDDGDIDYDSYNPSIRYPHSLYPVGIPNVNNGLGITRLPSSARTDEEWEQLLQDHTDDAFVYRYHGGKKYHVEVLTPGTQKQAARFCEYHEMQLVEVNNEIKNADLKWLLLDTNVAGPYWIGGKKKSGIWRWPTAQEDINYSNWAVGKPTRTGSKECIQVDMMGFWSDEDCNKVRYFICEVQMFPGNPVPTNPSVSTGQCPEPVINVYINTNLDGDSSSSLVSSKDVKLSNRGYQVLVNNKINLDKNTADGKTENEDIPKNTVSDYDALSGLGGL
ncbi:macrophage mannose receptor 1-like [Diabrotica undecimpunctata]|uniref:macrophage mannose receptor 1-like n=1 Tax=Diabrotica undecimpunctata TaxID=50387 RepID=UPI003B6365C5